MKSHVVSLYDYHQVDLSEFSVRFSADENKITDEMNRLVNRKASYQDGTTIAAGDMVMLSSSSDTAKYNRAKLQLAVGSNLFDAEFELGLIGMQIGESRDITTAKGSAHVTVLNVKNKTVPALTDALIAEYGPDGVNSIAEYRDYLINEQKTEILDGILWDAENKILKEVHKKSEFVIASEDFQHMMEVQLNRYSVLSELEGLDIKTMTKQDFEGKVPVDSYDQLINLMYRETWGYLENYLIGQHYAKTDALDLSAEAYEKAQQEYADFWHETLENAKRINTYEEFCILETQGLYLARIDAYVKSSILKED